MTIAVIKKIEPVIFTAGLVGISLLTFACSGKIEPPDSVSTISPSALASEAVATIEAVITQTTRPDSLDCHPYLTLDECKTLGSLSLIDDHPLYIMHYYGNYEEPAYSAETKSQPIRSDSSTPWGCSLFAALGDDEDRIYGRNFDWRFSPAILLFTHPDDGFDSVSMVDYEYLGFTGAEDLLAVPIEEKIALLRAPLLPFDGMNERGLVVGMAAVPASQGDPDPEKATIDSLGIIREMLDHAGSVPEAVSLFQRYNIDMGSGPPLHYLLADADGQSALLEYYRGEWVVMSSYKPWQSATNFLESPVKDNPTGQCWRHDLMEDRLGARLGTLSASVGLDLLEDVSQENTQWSIIYDLDKYDINVTMDRDFANIYNFPLREP